MNASVLTALEFSRPGDRVVQQATAGAQPVLQCAEIGGVVLDADVFGQADRRDGVEPGFRHVPVIEVTNFGDVLQALVDDRLLTPFGLLPGQRHAEGLHAAAGGVPDHGTPPAADVQQALTGLQAELVEDQGVFGVLGLFQAVRPESSTRAQVYVIDGPRTYS